MKDKVCIAVTGVGGRSVGHQILQSLLLLGKKYKIIATDADSFSYGLYQVDNRYIVPKANDADYIPAILRLIKKESVQALLPGTEAEVQILTEKRKQIEDAGCVLIINPSKVVSICSNKLRLYNWLKDNDFGTPLTFPANEWQTLVKKSGFPVVGKPTENSGASRHVTILKDKTEILKYLEETTGAEVIFQEYVGQAEEEFTVGVLVSKDGSVIDSIVIRRKLVGLSLGSERIISDRPYTLSTGYSQGYIIRHPLIQECCENLVVRLGMRGPANIQCRLTDKDVKIFEVHPRFSGTTSIRASADFNEPDILIRNFLFSENFKRIDYRFDLAAIRAFQNILVPISKINHVSSA